MPLRAKIMMGPLAKYKYYSKKKSTEIHRFIDRFPWKLLIHLALIMLSSA